MEITNYFLFSGVPTINSNTLTLKALDILENKEKEVKRHLNECIRNGNEEAKKILDLLELLNEIKAA